MPTFNYVEPYYDKIIIAHSILRAQHIVYKICDNLCNFLLIIMERTHDLRLLLFR